MKPVTHWLPKMLPNADPPHKISIIARGMALGYTKQISEDRYLLSPSQLKDMITVLVSGHAAEKLIYNEASTGAQDDLKRATSIARRMVTDLGMSEKLGPGHSGINRSWYSWEGKSRNKKITAIKRRKSSTTRWTQSSAAATKIRSDIV